MSSYPPWRGDPSRPIRVLILHMESTGSGHRRAAQAIAKALEPWACVETTIVNIVEFMNEALHSLYQTVRMRILDEAPHVFGQIYSWYDYEKTETSFVDRLLFSLERQSLRGLVQFLQQSQHDVAIHTHFFPAELAAHLRRTGQVSFPNLTVTTDFFSHAMWFHQPCERYFVATQDAGLYLRHLGAPPEAIEETGIPIDPQFERLRLDARAHAMTSEQRLKDIRAGRRRPRITFMATGLAPDVARSAQASILGAERGLEVKTLVGGDEERHRAVASVETPERHRVEVLGPTDQVPEILAETDLLVGKAGGLTSAEAMSAGCPMAILRPRPDQEEQNTDVLLEEGAALRVFRGSLLASKIDGLFSGEGTRWLDLRRNAHRLGRPEAAKRVGTVAFELAQTRASRALQVPKVVDQRPRRRI